MYTFSKYLIGVLMSISGLGAIFQGSIVGGVLLLSGGLIIIPAISKKIKISIWNNRKFRIVFTLGLIIVGLQFSMKYGKNTDKRELIIEYVKNDTLDNSLKGIKNLVEISELFGRRNNSIRYVNNDYVSQEYDSINQVYVVTFNPKLGLENYKNIEYIDSTHNKGALTNIVLKFSIDENDQIVSKTTHITLSKVGVVVYLNEDFPSIDGFINLRAINKQKELIVQEEKTSKIQMEQKIKLKKFEENCISDWNGAHSKLEELIKGNMNDPDSYEHIKTRYNILEDYAVVVMTYSGSNSFGATVRNSTTAKVNLQDCTVIEVE